MQEKDRFTLVELAYYLFYGFMILVKGLGFYEGQKIYTLSLIVGAALIVIKLLITEHTVAEWIFVGLLVALAVVIYAHSQTMAILIIIAVIVGMKGVSTHRIMIMNFILWTSTYVLQMLLTLTGIRSDIIRVQEKLGMGYMIRYSLGQPHPNVLQITTMLVTALFFYTFKPRGFKLLWYTLLMFLLNTYVFVYSVSYTGYVLSLLYLLINFYLSLRKKLYLVDNIAFCWIFPFCAYFTVWCALWMPSPWYDIVNQWLNTRLYLARNYYEHMGITLFGVGYCPELPVAKNNLDMGFIFALEHYGKIFFFLMLFGYIATIAYLIKKSRRYEIGIIFAMAAASTMEPFFFNSSMKNISWVFVGEFAFFALNRITVKHPEAKLARGYRVLKPEHIEKLKNEIVLPISKIEGFLISFRDSFRKRRFRIIFASLLLGAVAGYLAYTFLPINGTFYFNHSVVQTAIEEYITIDKAAVLASDPTAKVVQYINDEAHMFSITDQIGLIEYYRKVLSIGLWTCMIGMVALTFVGRRSVVKK